MSKKLPERMKIIRGTDRKDRANPNEPAPTGEIGEAPDHLPDDAKQAWGELVQDAPHGVLFNSDRIALEVAASLMAEFRRDPGMPAAKLGRLHSLLSSFGMTPSDRPRIAVAEPEVEDPWLKV